jgi:hypothetical protein
MANLNIRAYKIVYPDGEVGFEINRHDEGGGTSYKSINSLAEAAKIVVKCFFRNNNDPWDQASVDLTPYHNIVFSNHRTRRCLPLNETGATEFWQHYNKFV